MKRFTCIVIPVLMFAFAGCADSLVESQSELPPIIEVFACSDYCPGPREQYLKRAYKGVTDEEECRALGGRTFTYIGWGKFTICEVM